MINNSRSKRTIRAQKLRLPHAMSLQEFLSTDTFPGQTCALVLNTYCVCVTRPSTRLRTNRVSLYRLGRRSSQRQDTTRLICNHLIKDPKLKDFLIQSGNFPDCTPSPHPLPKTRPSIMIYSTELPWSVTLKRNLLGRVRKSVSQKLSKHVKKSQWHRKDQTIGSL